MASITLHKDGGISVDGRRSTVAGVASGTNTGPRALTAVPSGIAPPCARQTGARSAPTLMRWGDLRGAVSGCIKEQSAVTA